MPESLKQDRIKEEIGGVGRFMLFQKIKNMDPRWKSYALAGCICILFYVCITHLSAVFLAMGAVWNLFSPVILGAVIAYILYPLADFFDRWVFKHIKREKFRWILSVVVMLILVLSLFSVLMASLIPQLVTSIQSLLDNISTYFDNLVSFAKAKKAPFQEILLQLIDLISGAEDPLAHVGTLVADNLNDIIKTTTDIGSHAMNVLIGGIIAIYLLLAKQSIFRVFRRVTKLLMRPQAYARAEKVTSRFNVIFSRYLICEILDALIIGGVNFLFMIIMKMPDVLIISVIMGVTNLVPTFGPIVGCAVGSFLLLLESPGSVLPFLICTLVLQLADAYLIKPKFFGGVLNVPGVLILVAIIVFGRLWGIVGMLIAIPIAAILVYLVTEMLFPWLEHRRAEETGTPEEASATKP